MNIMQLSVLKNAGCAGGCKFCGLSITSQVNRQANLTANDFERSFEQARIAQARLEIVFPTVGANQLEVFDLLHQLQPFIQRYADVELAVNPGICTRPAFYSQLIALGVDRYRNNLECSRRLFRDMVPARPLAQEEKLRSLAIAREAGLKIDTGWLCGLGESAEDIEDILQLLSIASPDSITLNFFDPEESAETFTHTPPAVQTGLERLGSLKTHFSTVELTLGGAYELWLGPDALSLSGANGLYVGRFLDHGLKGAQISATKGSC